MYIYAKGRFFPFKMITEIKMFVSWIHLFRNFLDGRDVCLEQSRLDEKNTVLTKKAIGKCDFFQIYNFSSVFVSSIL